MRAWIYPLDSMLTQRDVFAILPEIAVTKTTCDLETYDPVRLRCHIVAQIGSLPVVSLAERGRSEKSHRDGQRPYDSLETTCIRMIRRSDGSLRPFERKACQIYLNIFYRFSNILKYKWSYNVHEERIYWPAPWRITFCAQTESTASTKA